MSREYLEALECLERIDNTLCLNNIKGKLEFGIDTEEHTDCDSVIGMTEDLDTIKQALQRLEVIDNAKPSEALVYMDAFIEENNTDIKNQINTGFDVDTQANLVKYLEYKSFLLSTIKQALLKAQEQEKELEILFKKQVDLGWLWYCIHECVNSLNEYNKKMPIEKFKLTQKEFDLLKEVLE